MTENTNEDIMISITNSEYNRLHKILEKHSLTVHKKKIYSVDYFQNTLKNKIKHCDCCNMDFKTNSYFNHKKSQKHIYNSQK